MADDLARAADEEHGLAYTAETDAELRLWSTFFVSRQIGGVLAATATLAVPSLGRDRVLLAAVAVLVVVPFDVWLLARTRRERRVPWASLANLLVAPAFVLWEPRLWVPASLASFAAVGLYAMAFRMPVPAVLLVVQAGLLAIAGVVAGVGSFAAGMLAQLVVGPPLVFALGALFQVIVSAERRYRDFLEYANDIVYTHDLKTLRFLTVNEAALEKTGYTQAELTDLSVADIVAPEHLNRAAEMVQRKVDGDDEATTYELDIVAKDGRRITVEVSTRVILRRGEPVAVQGIARDVSERKQVEAQRVALDKARSEFIANAAHELRTPLTTLAGLASVLASARERMTEEEIAEAVEVLDRQGRRARLLADKLLDLSSVELGTIDVLREPIDVAETVERALEAAPPPAGKHVDVAVGRDLKALGDSLRLQEILHNLLTNAYRYGGTHVRVEGESGGGAVVVAVADDGAGVPLDLLPHLFEPFARGDHGEGTGLGLAICARLAGAQGGDIVYEPRAAGGARFAVRLAAVG